MRHYEKQAHDGLLVSALKKNPFRLFIRDFKGEGSVGAQQVEIDRPGKTLGIGRNVLVFELDLALSALVVLGANIVIVDAEAQHHVVEGGDVEGKGLVPDGVALALLGRRNLGSIVLVAELQIETIAKREKDQTKSDVSTRSTRNNNHSTQEMECIEKQEMFLLSRKTNPSCRINIFVR